MSACRRARIGLLGRVAALVPGSAYGSISFLGYCRLAVDAEEIDADLVPFGIVQINGFGVTALYHGRLAVHAKIGSLSEIAPVIDHSVPAVPAFPAGRWRAIGTIVGNARRISGAIVLQNIFGEPFGAVDRPPILADEGVANQCAVGAVSKGYLTDTGSQGDLSSIRADFSLLRERLIGSIRRECLDHVVVFGERHLRHVLLSYMQYYNAARIHLSLNKDAPVPRAVGHILPAPILGGLHHHYVRM